MSGNGIQTHTSATTRRRPGRGERNLIQAGVVSSGKTEPAGREQATARKWWTLLSVCLGLLMLLVDITIVNVALPSIANDLSASFSDLQWTIDAYALSLAALLLVTGSLGDRIGHRTVFAGGVVVFTVASLLCGLAPDALVLILSRAAQGIGGAAMFASALALLAQEFKGRERGTAFGVFGATAGAAVSIGPLLGGALTSGISWRWVFFVNVPIGALTLLFLLTRVAETRRRQIRPDWLGAATYAAALFGIIFGLIRGNPDGWSSTKVVAALASGAALLVLFVVIELVREQPMLDFRLFRKPAFTGATLAAFAFGASLFSMFLYITLYLQNILHYSPIQAGLRILPLTLFVLLAAPISGRLTERVPLRLLLALGAALMAVGLGLMTRVAADSGWTVLILGFIVAGLGTGLFNPPRVSAAVATVPEEKLGVGSGVNNTAVQLGLATGIAGLGAVFESRVRTVLEGQLTQAAPQLGPRRDELIDQATSGNATQALHAVPPDLRTPVADALRVSFVSGFDRILWIAAAIALAGAIISLLLVRQRDLERPTDGDGEDANPAATGLAPDSDAVLAGIVAREGEGPDANDAGTGAWRLDPKRSSVEFHAPHFWGLATVKGHFESYQGTLDLGADPAIELTIDATSLETGNRKRDQHLRSADFFDAEQHRYVRFVSKSAGLDGDTLKVGGHLHARGSEIPLEIDAHIHQVGGELEIEATTNAPHRDLGMTGAHSA
jgi:EmrB/QacA subfamily drug resistance transporter